MEHDDLSKPIKEIWDNDVERDLDFGPQRRKQLNRIKDCKLRAKEFNDTLCEIWDKQIAKDRKVWNKFKSSWLKLFER